MNRSYSLIMNIVFLYSRRAPQQRVVGDGIKNMEKANNHEEMSAIMHGSQSANPPRPTSGRRAMPAHLQRSELW